MSNNDKNNMISQHIKINSPQLSEPKVNALARETFAQRNFDDPKNIEYLKNMEDDFLYNKNGIFCLSRLNNNPIMWSHYADSHKGFCIGYSIPRFEAFLDRYCDCRNGMAVSLFKVNYVQNYPILIPDPDINNIEHIKNQLITKFIDWEYEQEFRYIMTGNINQSASIDNYRKVTIDQDIISEVIMGCRMPDSDKSELMDWLKNLYSDVKVFQVKIKENSFALDFEEVKI